MSKYDFASYGGRGVSQNMILYYAMWGEGRGGKSKYDFVLCNVWGGAEDKFDFT